MAARGDVAFSQAPPWPKNRLRIRPIQAGLCGWGPIRAETRQRLAEALWAHLVTNARFTLTGDRTPNSTMGGAATASCSASSLSKSVSRPSARRLVRAWGLNLRP